MVTLPVAQLLFALSNYIFILGAMRLLVPHDFAAVSIAWIGSAVMTNAQRIVVSEQVIVAARTGARSRLDSVGPSAGMLFGGTLFAVCAVGLTFRMSIWPALGIASFIGFNLYYDALRYRAIYRDDVRGLLRADLGVAVGIAATYAASAGLRSTQVFVVGVIAFTVAGALVLGGARLPSPRPVLNFVQQVGSYAGWSLVQATVINFAAQSVILLAVPLISISEFAHIRAVQSAVSPLATLVRAVEPKLVTLWSGRLAAGDPVRRDLTAWLLIMVPVAAAATAVLSATAALWAPLLLGSQYAEVGPYVVPIVGATLLAYVGAPGGVLLRVLREGKTSSLAQLGAVAGASCGMLVFPQLWEGVGAAWAMGGQAFLSVTLAYLIVFRHASLRVRR